MSDQEKQESQKTIVAFAAGLLIGGLLVWIFGGSPKVDAPTNETNGENTAEENQTTNEQNTSDTATNTTTTEAPTLVTGEGKIEVGDQKAGSAVALKSAVYPTDEGWIGVRDYANGQASGLLGVARYSKEQGLVPETIQLQRATITGKEYALVFYTESGDRVFSLADDKQIDGVTATFKAQ
jgi:cytoskeletal protein RodZ